MTFIELRSLMAAQIFAGLAGGQFLKTLSHEQIRALAKTAADAAEAIENEVAKQQTPKS